MECMNKTHTLSILQKRDTKSLQMFWYFKKTKKTNAHSRPPPHIQAYEQLPQTTYTHPLRVPFQPSLTFKIPLGS